jgi:hypothetical protein
VQEQVAAFEAFIQQDDYLRSNRGSYVERNAVFGPIAYNADLSITQDIFRNVAGKRNTIQLRLDILNVGNLLNDNWGQGFRFVANGRPLVSRGADAQGRPLYRFRNVSNSDLLTETFEKTALTGDVWRMQLGLRYIFN